MISFEPIFVTAVTIERYVIIQIEKCEIKYERCVNGKRIRYEKSDGIENGILMKIAVD